MNIEKPEDAATAQAQATTPGLVVGLGASAGGIVMLQRFFARVAPASGVAYVVVLHLSPEHESRLAEVLQATTPMPVERVTEATRVFPDRVYVISPNTSLRMADGVLTVSDVLRMEERRAPVDIFFRTLADAHGSDAVAIVLSGTGPNGSNGIKRVKECGGLVIAQDPSEAEHDDMPRNSIATGCVDYVLRVAEMPGRIAAYQAQRGHTAASAPAAGDQAVSALRDILTVLRVRTGHDFSNYKTATVQRRIERRQHLHELPDLPAYARFVRQHPGEATSLLQELLISVTHFFRDAPVFAALEQHIVPRLLKGRRRPDHLRVWVAGCATGEEAYSVAMLLAEAAAELAKEPALQVFATDLDETAVASAREGFYTDADVADVSAVRLRRFFTREPGGYRVRRDLRETVLFAHHNVLKDPPFSHLDLVCCRNLLIYLNRAAQEAVIETFHFALNPGGYLLLGNSETADVSGELFATIDKNAHIYESRAMAVRPLPPVPDLPTHQRITLPRASASTLRPLPRSSERPSGADLHFQLLEEFAAPSIVVDQDHQIVHVSPTAGEYLQVSGGEPSRDLMRLIRPEWRVDLRTALYQAARDRTTIQRRGARVAAGGDDLRSVRVTVRPVLGESDPPRGFFIVLFDDRDVEVAAVASADAPPEPRTDANAATQLEEELATVKTQLRSIVEQYETQAEEAKAANEELQAVNEELRSAAEELETSKEELQSVNEELTTVNQELKIKIEELGLTNNDFQNLINSTEIGTIFLDRTLRVKLSTPKARDVFNLLPLDAGRPLSDITGALLYEGLADDAQLVLERLQTVERELQTKDGRWFLTRVLPYRTTDERIEGVVMTFQDITDRRRAESSVRLSEERLRLLIDSVEDYAIFTMSSGGTIDSWNSGARRMFGYNEDEVVGRPVALLFTEEDREAGIPAAELARAAQEGRADDERWHMRKDGTRLYCSGVTAPLGETPSRGFAKIARDLTGPREAAEALLRAQESVEERVRERTEQLRAEVVARSDAEQRVTTLIRQLVTAQEDERARIARDIHDHVGQQLTALKLSLERHEQRCGGNGGADEDLQRAAELTREIDAEIDFLAWQLRPAALDDLGLLVALPKYLRAWSEHHRVAAQFRTTGLSAKRLSPEAETTFYRVAQEALNNIAKHAHATRADVILEGRDGAAVLVVEDDGVGFEVPEEVGWHGGLGLVGMRERAALVGATFEIESAPGQGTTIFVRLPAETA